jgi:hypothetical protein
MTAWSPGPPGYDDHGVGTGRYHVGDVDAIGYHGYERPLDLIAGSRYQRVVDLLLAIAEGVTA